MWTETTTNIPVLVLLEKYNHYYHQVGRNHVAENSWYDTDMSILLVHITELKNMEWSYMVSPTQADG